ncbi:MAG: type I 3-dehydroquinate dehydratase [bacterium]|nr:type I 3-dehydroquinate dehydratase [bacterium]
MSEARLVATMTTLPSDPTELTTLPEGVGYLEVRADLVGKIDPDWLREHFPGKLIYTLRSRAEGGKSEGGRQSRRRHLSAAVAAYDLVDLEGRQDLFPELLDEVPPAKRLISWHGPATHLTGLQSRFEELSATEARFYKLIPTAVHADDGIRPLALVKTLGRDDVVAFASGEVGTWTRFLAPHLGSPLIYGSLGETPAASGQPTVARLAEHYGLPRLPRIEQLFGIVGRPVMHSLSPRLHNGAYRELGIAALYVPFHVESFGDFWLDVVEAGSLDVLGIPLRGLSVTAPFKEVALAVSGVSSPRAQHIGAANTLIRDDDGVWEAEITDPEGVVGLLERAGLEIRGRQAAVVGCGGAGKATAFGLHLAGAAVTLVNRGENRGRKAAIELRLPFRPLAQFDPEPFDIIIHATTLGRRDGDLPFRPDRMRPEAAVVDLVYGAEPTPLTRAVRRLGIRCLEGREVLVYQTLRQFRVMTGRELGESLARRLLGLPEEIG